MLSKKASETGAETISSANSQSRGYQSFLSCQRKYISKTSTDPSLTSAKYLDSSVAGLFGAVVEANWDLICLNKK